ncbi:hypothetical protein ACS0TY_012240 [Phlomoides rotata]
MAAARCRASLPIFRPKNASPITESSRRFARLLLTQKRDSSSAVNHIPTLQKLLKAPSSKIKSTLESEFTSDSTEFPWASLVSSLNTSAPQKANLIIEWKLEKLAKEDRKNHDCYIQLLSLCESIRNLPIALFVFSSMEAEGVRPTSSVFTALISTSLSSRNFLTALSLFEIMEGSESYRPDSDTYDAFIRAYANSGNKTATKSWLTAKRDSGFPVHARTYGFLVHCCIKSMAFEDAERYLDEMKLEGLMPDEPTLLNVLLMYCKQKNFGKMKEILKLILNLGMQIDRFMSMKVVELYVQLGVVEQLEELLEMLTRYEQSLEVLALVHGAVIRWYAEKDRLDDVEYCLGRMVKMGISFSCEEDVQKVICLYFRREAYDTLDLFLESIKDSYKLTRFSYELLGAGYRRAGLVEKLNGLVKEMKEAGLA